MTAFRAFLATHVSPRTVIGRVSDAVRQHPDTFHHHPPHGAPGYRYSVTPGAHRHRGSERHELTITMCVMAESLTDAAAKITQIAEAAAQAGGSRKIDIIRMDVADLAHDRA